MTDVIRRPITFKAAFSGVHDVIAIPPRGTLSVQTEMKPTGDHGVGNRLVTSAGLW